MAQQGYPTDLTDGEWALLTPHLPPASPRGRPRVHSYRVILNAIFYLVRGGCAWRLLPRDLPPWQTMYHYFRQWRDDGRPRHMMRYTYLHLRWQAPILPPRQWGACGRPEVSVTSG